MDKFSCNVSSNPTFSSTLLDAIYGAIDENEDEAVVYRETMRKKQHSRIDEFKDEEEMANIQRLQMIEKWMEKQSEKRRWSNSSRSSSDSSSSRGGFSSSEAEENVFAGPTNRSPLSSCYGFKKPKQIKTNIVSAQPEHEGGFEKTKSRALQIYLDLKKDKQQTSPSGKFYSFLNSVFSTMHEKRAKFAAERDRKSKSSNSLTSSFSRSCLSRTPSSRVKLSNNETKRSVRFHPVSEIVDEDYFQPCGHKILGEETPRLEEGKHIKIQTDPSLILLHEVDYINTISRIDKNIRTIINEEFKIYNYEKNHQVGEGAKGLLKNYQKMVDLEIDFKMSHLDKNFIDEVEEDIDAMSCSSSDLFELDDLSAI